MRTFERGVEGETLSCGTGVTACGYLYLLKNTDFNEVKIQTEGGQLIVQRQGERTYLSALVSVFLMVFSPLIIFHEKINKTPAKSARISPQENDLVGIKCWAISVKIPKISP